VPARLRLPALVRAAAVLAAVAVLAAPAATQAATPRLHLRFDAEFTKTALSSTWTQYNGQDHCCAMTYWLRTHLVEAGGVLTQKIGKDPARGYKWTAAGMSQGRSLNQTYGAWYVRFRMNRGTGTAFAMMLWPQHGWPPEIDFAEEGPRMGTTRSVITSTLHYGARNTMIHHSVNADFTRWHTVGVVWTRGRVSYRLDGRTWATITGSVVPHQPMHLCIQTEVGPKGNDRTYPTAATPSPTRLQIDWVRVYSYS
jgi:beta-glucanase (GH16 family)